MARPDSPEAESSGQQHLRFPGMPAPPGRAVIHGTLSSPGLPWRRFCVEAVEGEEAEFLELSGISLPRFLDSALLAARSCRADSANASAASGHRIWRGLGEGVIIIIII